MVEYGRGGKWQMVAEPETLLPEGS